MEKTRNVLITLTLGVALLFGGFASFTANADSNSSDSSNQQIAAGDVYEILGRDKGGRVIQPPL